MNEKEAFIEANRCLSCNNPRCQTGCPTGMQIRDFILKIKEDKLQEAAKIIRTCSSLSTICSVVCPHEKQCVGHCVLNAKKAPIQIGKLEKYVFDSVEYNEGREAKTTKKVAVIGTGPASIACALEVAIAGGSVTMFEAESHFGGVLSYGIPSFRLETQRIVNLEEKLTKLGVKINYNTKLTEVDMYELKKEYDAVFIGIGLTKVRRLGIPNEESENVYDALSFLKQANYENRYEEGELPELSGTTIVVGAGNVAMDAARMAIRCGSEKVMVVYRRTLQEAPANTIDIEEAKMDGVLFMFLTNPVEVLTEDNKVCGLRCEKMVLGDVDTSGRRSPIGSGEYITLPCNTIISAIGQIPEKIFTNDIFKTDHGYLVCEDMVTSISEIYAGGDIVLGAKTVVEAQRCGRIAAKKIIEN